MSLTAWDKELSRGQAAPRELAENCLARMKAEGHNRRAIIRAEEESSLQRVCDLGEKPDRAAPSLWGLPYVAQDDLCTAGVPTACGSFLLENYRPPLAAAALERVEEAGAVRLGKAAMPEFVLGANRQETVHPEQPRRLAGAGSDGAAAAVAAGMALFALGGDTCGSLRTSASFCGLSGLKPTYGRISRQGVISVAPSLEQVGILASAPRDCARVLEACAGGAGSDSTCARQEWKMPRVWPPAAELTVGLVAVDPGSLTPRVQDSLHEGVQRLEEQGARVEEVSLPHLDAAATAALTIACAEASSELANLDGVRLGRQEPADNLQEMYRRTRGQGFGPAIKAAVIGGTALLTESLALETYEQALRVRTLVTADLAYLLTRYHLLLMPAALQEAPAVPDEHPGLLWLGQQWFFTCLASLSGYPALSVPVGAGSPAPAGVQLVAPPWREDLLLAAGEAMAPGASS